MWISWKHEDTDFSAPLTFEQKVEVFYEQTLGWQLHIADLIANGGTAFGEFKQGLEGLEVVDIVLHICLSYFELVGSIRTQSAKLNYTKKFKAGFRSVFPGLFMGPGDGEKLLACLHKGGRCGLYQLGRTPQRVGLGPADGNAIAYNSQTDGVTICPERLPKELKAHLDRFRLLAPTQSVLVSCFHLLPPGPLSASPTSSCAPGGKTGLDSGNKVSLKYPLSKEAPLAPAPLHPVSN
jgi:hypothetical protein